MLLPDGIRFPPARPAVTGPTRQSAKIRSFYGRFTETGGGTQVNLQGIVFGTNDGGLLPLEKYLRRNHPPSRRTRLWGEEPCQGCGAGGLEREVPGHRSGRLCTATERLPILETFAPTGNSQIDDAPALTAEISQWQEGDLAVHECRPDRQGRRPKSLDGAGHPDRERTGAPAEDAGGFGWP